MGDIPIPSSLRSMLSGLRSAVEVVRYGAGTLFTSVDNMTFFEVLQTANNLVCYLCSNLVGDD